MTEDVSPMKMLARSNDDEPNPTTGNTLHHPLRSLVAGWAENLNAHTKEMRDGKQ